MTKLTSKGNCWQAFLSYMMGTPLNYLHRCSTENEDWQKQTEHELANARAFYIEVDPRDVTPLPENSLVGARVAGPNLLPHIVVAKVIRNGQKHGFIVHYDPSGNIEKGKAINPATIVIFCQLIRSDI